MCDIKNYYETNKDFRRYTDRYAAEFDLTTEQALTHSVIRNAAEYYENAEKGKISVTEVNAGCGGAIAGGCDK